MPKLSPDKKWRRFNEKLQKLMKSSDWLGLGVTYYQMAEFLEGEDRDSSQVRQKGYEMKLKHTAGELRRYENQGVKKVEVLATHDSCRHCKKLEGKVFPLKKAVEANPIPIEACEHKYGCRCIYLPSVDY